MALSLVSSFTLARANRPYGAVQRHQRLQVRALASSSSGGEGSHASRVSALRGEFDADPDKLFDPNTERGFR